MEVYIPASPIPFTSKRKLLGKSEDYTLAGENNRR